MPFRAIKEKGSSNEGGDWEICSTAQLGWSVGIEERDRQRWDQETRRACSLMTTHTNKHSATPACTHSCTDTNTVDTQYTHAQLPTLCSLVISLLQCQLHSLTSDTLDVALHPIVVASQRWRKYDRENNSHVTTRMPCQAPMTIRPEWGWNSRIWMTVSNAQSLCQNKY